MINCKFGPQLMNLIAQKVGQQKIGSGSSLRIVGNVYSDGTVFLEGFKDKTGEFKDFIDAQPIVFRI